MKHAFWLIAAFGLLVAGVEALKILVAWWQAGHPAPGLAEWAALAVFGVAGVVWWRHSVFACRTGCHSTQGEDKATADKKA